MLEGHDLILVVGSSVFPYYPNIPGPLLPEGAELVQITDDPDEAARAPMGDAIVADVAAHARGAARARRAVRARRRREPRPAPVVAEESDPDERVDRRARCSPSVFPENGDRRRSSRPRAPLALRNQLRLSRPGQLVLRRRRRARLRAAGGASACARRARAAASSACVGEGSAQYAIQALWTAATYDVPVTFLVLRNEEYAILKWFGELEQVTGAPGLDLPALDTVAVAAGYGVPATRADGAATSSSAALRDAFAAGRPAPRRGAGRARHGHGVAPTRSRGAVARCPPPSRARAAA